MSPRPPPGSRGKRAPRGRVGRGPRRPAGGRAARPPSAIPGGREGRCRAPGPPGPGGSAGPAPGPRGARGVGGPPARRRRWPRAALWEPGGRCGARTRDLGARRVPVLRGVGAQGPREPDNLAPPAGEEAQPRGVSAAAATRGQGPVPAAGGRRPAGERPRAGPRSDRGGATEAGSRSAGRAGPGDQLLRGPGPAWGRCAAPAPEAAGEGRLPGDMGDTGGAGLRTCRPSCPGP